MPFCYPYYYGPPPTVVRLKSVSSPSDVRLQSEIIRCTYGVGADRSCTIYLGSRWSVIGGR